MNIKIFKKKFIFKLIELNNYFCRHYSPIRERRKRERQKERERKRKREREREFD